MIIGADGIHSQVRSFISGAREVSPKYSKYVTWRGILEYKDFDEPAFESWGASKRFAAIPLLEPNMFWYAAVQEASEKNAKEYQARPLTEQDKENKILKEFEKWHDPIPKIIERTPIQNIICAPIYDLPALPTWHGKRLVLLGDACHATQVCSK